MCSGVTLAEILISFAILAFAMLPISNLIGFVHQGTQKDFRSTKAIELLVERMNQMSSLPYRQLSPLVTPGTTLHRTTTLFPGQNIQVTLGDSSVGNATFTITADLDKFPASFTYRSRDLMVFTTATSTWRFDPEVIDTYNNAGGGPFAYKVMKVKVKVAWTEPVVNASRAVEAMTFVVDLED